jgi:hypothetical protein
MRPSLRSTLDAMWLRSRVDVERSTGHPKLPITFESDNTADRKDRPMAKKNGKLKKATPRWYRDAISGRFVTKKYAKKHRKTTLKETRTRV